MQLLYRVRKQAMAGMLRMRTIGRVLLDYLHETNDARNFATGVIEECQVTLFHGAHIVPGFLC